MDDRYTLFLDPILKFIARFLTNDETEQLLRRLPEDSSLGLALRNYSSENLKRLDKEKSYKRKFCEHKGQCRHNCVRGFLKTFTAVYVVKYIVAILPLLIKKKIFSNPYLLIRMGGKDTIRFALFLALFVGGFKGINCALRKIRNKEDRWNAFIAGSVAGLSLLVDDHSRRIPVALYLSSRALEFSYVYLMNRGYLPSWSFGDALVMGLSSAQILWAYVMEPQSLPSSYMSFLVEHGGMNKHGKQGREYLKSIGEIVATGDTDITPYREIFEDFPIPFDVVKNGNASMKLHCFEHPTTSSCTVGHTKFFMESIPRSLKLYLPLNVIMALVLKNTQIVKNPQRILTKTILSTLRSSLFLSLYCTTAWLVPCFLRNLAGQREHFLYYYVNGFCAGLCVLVEAKGRRIELAMYCFPRAAESLWNVLVKNGYAKNIKNGEAIYFALAAGALTMIYHNEPENLNTAFRTVMTRIFGKN